MVYLLCLKDFNFTFFRSDVVREIFFHFTEVREGDNVDLGDDVEFTIQVTNSFNYWGFFKLNLLPTNYSGDLKFNHSNPETFELGTF